MPHADALAPALLERVLSKLGLSEPPSPTLEGLRTLYPAWCRKVPFDNIRQLIHRRNQDPSPMPGGEATEFFEAWLVYGTGGTCWSGNGALHTLLLSLGMDRKIKSPFASWAWMPRRRLPAALVRWRQWEKTDRGCAGPGVHTVGGVPSLP